jgi:hypothetical protein
MRSIVEKTLRVRSDLTHGSGRYRRSVRTVRLDGSPMLGQAGGGLAQKDGWRSRARQKMHKSICLTVFGLIYLIGMS